MKALCNAYRDRRRRKRDFRRLWIAYQYRSSPERRELQPSDGRSQEGRRAPGPQMLAQLAVVDPGAAATSWLQPELNFQL